MPAACLPAVPAERIVMLSPHAMEMAADAQVRYKLAFIRVLGAGGQYVVVQVKLMMFQVRGCGGAGPSRCGVSPALEQHAALDAPLTSGSPLNSGRECTLGISQRHMCKPVSRYGHGPVRSVGRESSQ